MHRTLAALGAAALLSTAAALPAAGDPVWVPSLPSQPQGQVDLDLFADGTGYAMRSNGGSNGPLVRTTDAGVTWLPATTPPLRSTGTIEFATADLGYGLGFGGDLHRTVDGAVTWSESPFPLPEFGSADTLDVDGDSVAIGVGVPGPDARTTPSCPIDPFGDVVELARSDDRGATWRFLRVQDRPGSVRAAAMDGDRLALVTSDTTWQRTGTCRFDGSSAIGQRVVVHDGSDFDEVLACPLASCWDVVWVGDDLLVLTIDEVVVIGPAGEVVARSQLDGAIEQAAGLTVQRVPDGFSFVDDRVGYASIGGNGIWRTEDGGRTWVTEASPVDVPGATFGDIAAAGDLGLAGGANAIVRRQPTP